MRVFMYFLHLVQCACDVCAYVFPHYIIVEKLYQLYGGLRLLSEPLMMMGVVTPAPIQIRCVVHSSSRAEECLKSVSLATTCAMASPTATMDRTS